MNKLEGWEDVQAIKSGAVEKLPAGAYECSILKAEERQSKSGKKMLVFALDILTGDYAGYFKRQYDRRQQFANGNPVAWGCLYYQLTEGESMGRFKGVIMTIEESNGIYKWDWDETKLAKKKVGVVFREEEFLTNDGKIKTAVKPYYLIPIDKVADEPTPEPLRINQETQNNAFGGITNCSDIPF